MKKPTEKTLLAGAMIGASAAIALSSKKVRTSIKQAVKGKDKTKLDAIKEILEDKTTDSKKKAGSLKDKVVEKKNDLNK